MNENVYNPRRYKKKSKKYFTEEHEKAIIEYIETFDQVHKNKLFRYVIQPVFKELISKIVLTYRYNTLPDIEEAKHDALVHLVMILEQFDKTRGKKAFSYFTVVTINFFKKLKKDYKKRKFREVAYDKVISSEGASLSTKLDEQNLTYNLEYEREEQEFYKFLITHIEDWLENCPNLTEMDVKIFKAIKIIFEDTESLRNFDKKFVYKYIREISGISKKKITKTMKKAKLMYQQYKDNWDNGEI